MCATAKALCVETLISIGTRPWRVNALSLRLEGLVLVRKVQPPEAARIPLDRTRIL